MDVIRSYDDPSLNRIGIVTMVSEQSPLPPLPSPNSPPTPSTNSTHLPPTSTFNTTAAAASLGLFPQSINHPSLQNPSYYPSPILPNPQPQHYKLLNQNPSPCPLFESSAAASLLYFPSSNSTSITLDNYLYSHPHPSYSTAAPPHHNPYGKGSPPAIQDPYAFDGLGFWTTTATATTTSTSSFLVGSPAQSSNPPTVRRNSPEKQTMNSQDFSLIPSNSNRSSSVRPNASSIPSTQITPETVLDYYCDICLVDCSYKRYKNNQLRDYYLCIGCFTREESELRLNLLDYSYIEDDERKFEVLEYHCNRCLTKCTGEHYRCNKVLDYHLCLPCFANKELELGLTLRNFVLVREQFQDDVEPTNVMTPTMATVDRDEGLDVTKVFKKQSEDVLDDTCMRYPEVELYLKSKPTTAQPPKREGDKSIDNMSSHIGLPALDVFVACPQATPASVFPQLASDYYQFDDLLSSEEKALRKKVREVMEKEVAPVMSEHWEKAEFPFHLIPKLGTLGVAGGTIKGYGCPGISIMGSAITLAEVARVDASCSTFILVHSSLAMLTIALCGSEEQKKKYFPSLAQLRTVACWALTEPNYGSVQAEAAYAEQLARMRGEYYAANVPLDDGINDESYQSLFKSVVAKVMEVCKPCVIWECDGRTYAVSCYLKLIVRLCRIYDPGGGVASSTVSSHSEGGRCIYKRQASDSIHTSDKDDAEREFTSAVVLPTDQGLLGATGGTDVVINLWHDSTVTKEHETFDREQGATVRGQELENAKHQAILSKLKSRISSASRSLVLLKSCAKNFEPILPIYASKFEFISGMQRTLLHNLNSSGRKLFAGSFLGLSAAAGMIYNQSTVAYAMNDCDADYCEPSGFLKDDLNTFWFLARKCELPIVLILTVLVGWRHPFALAVNIALLLLCTKPSPSSIYMFIEQVRQKDMNQKQILLGNRFLYVKNVNVEDYRVLCLAKN